MRWPTTRAMMSFGPPGGKGTISRMFLLGKSWAAASVGHSRANPISSGLKAFTAFLPLMRCVEALEAFLIATLRHCQVRALDSHAATSHGLMLRSARKGTSRSMSGGGEGLGYRR